MTCTVIIEPAAWNDLVRVYLRIAEDAPVNADRWLHAIEEAMYGLDTMPAAYPVARDSQYFDEEVRQMTFRKTYRVLFAIRDDRVHVLMVRHGARRDLTEELND